MIRFCFFAADAHRQISENGINAKICRQKPKVDYYTKDLKLYRIVRETGVKGIIQKSVLLAELSDRKAIFQIAQTA